jgi:hypothetical protein
MHTYIVDFYHMSDHTHAAREEITLPYTDDLDEVIAAAEILCKSSHDTDTYCGSAGSGYPAMQRNNGVPS